MKTRLLGRTGLHVSALSFGASSLGGVFHAVDETEAIRAVHAALDLGINYFDVAPAYGGTRSETVLGKALRGIPRDRYYISTKIGKYTNPEKYGDDTLDYSRERTRRSIEESATRLGSDYFDIIHIHDIEYQDRRHTEWALTEGFESVHELKQEGRIGAVSFGIYPMDLWHRILTTLPVDAALVHNHYSLHDTRLLELLPLAQEKGIGLINASPFGSGLLTDRGRRIGIRRTWSSGPFSSKRRISVPPGDLTFQSWRSSSPASTRTFRPPCSAARARIPWNATSPGRRSPTTRNWWIECARS